MTGVQIRTKFPIEHKKIVEVVRIESDRFETCEPKVERKRVHLIGEKVFLIHRMPKGVWDIKEL